MFQGVRFGLGMDLSYKYVNPVATIGSDNPANAAEPDATANVLMDGPFFSGQSWRNLQKTSYAPYGSSTTPAGGGFNYEYGDEVVRFDGSAWIYETSGSEIARAWSTEPYPWLATTWNNNFYAAKVISSYAKATNYPEVP
jgi:hypothetical protein